MTRATLSHAACAALPADDRRCERHDGAAYGIVDPVARVVEACPLELDPAVPWA
jgi:hypothetical protein